MPNPFPILTFAVRQEDMDCALPHRLRAGARRQPPPRRPAGGSPWTEILTGLSALQELECRADRLVGGLHVNRVGGVRAGQELRVGAFLGHGMPFLRREEEIFGSGYGQRPCPDSGRRRSPRPCPRRAFAFLSSHLCRWRLARYRALRTSSCRRWGSIVASGKT